MEKQENEIVFGHVFSEEDIKNKVKTVGVKGLDTEKAKEFGVFQRISNLLCATHSTIMAAYRIYGGVDYLIDQLSARKNEIAKEMNAFDKAFEHFTKFWTNYYAHGTSEKEVNFETERLYHKIMKWMQMPERWQIGDKQRTESEQDICMAVNLPDNRVFCFFKTNENQEIINEPSETWGVFCYNPHDNKQIVVEKNIDKASAFMVAKRLSDENKECIYSVSVLRDVVEKRTEIIPVRAYRANETIGKIK